MPGLEDDVIRRRGFQFIVHHVLLGGVDPCRIALVLRISVVDHTERNSPFSGRPAHGLHSLAPGRHRPQDIGMEECQRFTQDFPECVQPFRVAFDPVVEAPGRQRLDISDRDIRELPLERTQGNRRVGSHLFERPAAGVLPRVDGGKEHRLVHGHVAQHAAVALDAARGSHERCAPESLHPEPAAGRCGQNAVFQGKRDIPPLQVREHAFEVGIGSARNPLRINLEDPHAGGGGPPCRARVEKVHVLRRAAVAHIRALEKIERHEPDQRSGGRQGHCQEQAQQPRAHGSPAHFLRLRAFFSAEGCATAPSASRMRPSRAATSGFAAARFSFSSGSFTMSNSSGASPNPRMYL